MPAATTYRAKAVQVTYDSIAITGFAEGSFVKIMQDKETFTKSMDSDGGGCFVQDADESGSIEITLHQASPANALLMARANAQKAGSAGPATMTVRDGNGSYLGEAYGFLTKVADTERSNVTTNQVWKVITLAVKQEGGGVTTQ